MAQPLERQNNLSGLANFTRVSLISAWSKEIALRAKKQLIKSKVDADRWLYNHWTPSEATAFPFKPSWSLLDQLLTQRCSISTSSLPQRVCVQHRSETDHEQESFYVQHICSSLNACEPCGFTSACDLCYEIWSLVLRSSQPQRCPLRL